MSVKMQPVLAFPLDRLSRAGYFYSFEPTVGKQQLVGKKMLRECIPCLPIIRLKKNKVAVVFGKYRFQ